MDIEKNLVRIIGVNTHGLKSNSVYIASLIESNDIIFICEHWLSNAEKLIVAELTKNILNCIISTHNNLYINILKLLS